MKKFIRILSASIALFTSAAFAAPADNTASQYKPTNGAVGSVGATVIQQSVDGYNSIPINSTHPLPVSVVASSGGDATAANQVTANGLLGALTETAPATDTASSGLNGRLQRIAQRLTSLIALLPSSLGAKTTSASLAVTLPSDGTAVQLYSLPASNWNYAAASSGISNTTDAVTIKTAAGGALRNCITHVDVDAGTLGAATEVAIRDGAGGTVLWRGIEGTGGGFKAVDLMSPICGTANTLLEVVTLTATVTGGVYINVSGFTR